MKAVHQLFLMCLPTAKALLFEQTLPCTRLYDQGVHQPSDSTCYDKFRNYFSNLPKETYSFIE
jgi:hypothetical protein